MSVADWLRSAGEETWVRAMGMPFLQDVSADRLPPEVFDSYLRTEHRFVDTAARALGRAVHLAPTLAARRRLAVGLHDLVTDQIGYFARVAERRGIRLDEEGAEARRKAAPLHDHFLSLANRGDYPSLLAGMLGAEWLYASWCDGVDPGSLSDPDLADWVGLHRDVAFLDHVRWLREELDQVAGAADDVECAELLAAFTGTLRAEIDFHDAPYADDVH